jgi:hypothetical protein
MDETELACFPYAIRDANPSGKHPVAESAESEASGGHERSSGVSFNLRSKTKPLNIVAACDKMYVCYISHIHEKEAGHTGTG